MAEKMSSKQGAAQSSITVRIAVFLLSVIWASLSLTQEAPMVFLTSHAETGSSATTAKIMQQKLEEYLGRSVEYQFQQGTYAGVGVPPDGNTMIMSCLLYTSPSPRDS